MILITRNQSSAIFWLGVALALAGGVLAYLALQRYDSLPNYQRIGCIIPLLASYPMLRFDRYRNWAAIDIRERGRAVMAIVAPLLLLAGSLVWFFASPDARG